MSVFAIFTYEVKPGRMDDFMAKLGEAASPRFNCESMPQSVRLFRNSVPGPDTHSLILIIEYADMAAYDARTCFENESAEWQRLFGNQADSPELLRSVQLLTEFHP